MSVGVSKTSFSSGMVLFSADLLEIPSFLKRSVSDHKGRSSKKWFGDRIGRPHERGLLVTYLRWTKTEPAEFSTRVSFRPEMFSGIGALPKPATESHVVSRGNPVAPRRLKAQGKRATRVGSLCSPDFPNIMSCLRKKE